MGGETITYAATGGADVPAFRGAVKVPVRPKWSAPDWKWGQVTNCRWNPGFQSENHHTSNWIADG
jgi:hypothetical protein